MLRGWLFLALVCVACSDPVPPDRTVEQLGPYQVGTRGFLVENELEIQVWFPAQEGPAFDPFAIEMVESGSNMARYAGLLAAANSCPTRTLPVMPAMEPQGGPYPLVLLSHCHSCTKLSNATTAVRLASHGFIAVALDHAGDTLWGHLDGMDAPIDGEQLEIRAAQARRILDFLETAQHPLNGSIDFSKVGILGHSMGAVTAGRVAQLDSRIGAAAALCAPMENPLVPGVKLSELEVPLMFVVAKEDNSITEFGNKFIRDNFTDATVPAYKIEVPDAGHWSISDLDGLVDIFKAGCGDGIRQTDGADFTYLDPSAGRAIAASYATAFFKATLLDEAGSRAYVESASDAFGVSLEVNHHD